MISLQHFTEVNNKLVYSRLTNNILYKQDVEMLFVMFI